MRGGDRRLPRTTLIPALSRQREREPFEDTLLACAALRIVYHQVQEFQNKCFFGAKRRLVAARVIGHIAIPIPATKSSLRRSTLFCGPIGGRLDPVVSCRLAHFLRG